MSEPEAGVRVLIADDDAATRLILRRRVEAWGHETVLVENGREALEVFLGDDPPRVAILDWVMPELDGLEVCRHLAEEEAARPFIYAILLTSKEGKDNLITAFESGAHDYLVKPPDPDELRCRLNVGLRVVAAEDKTREYAERMEALARTDALTEIHNRRYFLELAGREMARVQRFGQTSSLLALDIDHFKAVNDTHGHDMGDEVLKAFARTVAGCLRETDLFGRVGGEEFSVILPQTGAEGAMEVAERVRVQVSEIAVPLPAGENLSITCSVGVHPIRQEDGESFDEACKVADEALYEAKESGRNRVVLKSSRVTRPQSRP
ncbi:MAG: diguanylate cyclase [Planctomycetota bacterium]|jgi:diguanylate cyclase (GGDEF)-like protein